MRGGPLAGLLVVDLSRALAGPQATMMLGDLGARVIKVESADGDETRAWGPPFVDGSDGARYSTYFLSCNRNKESVVLNLKSADGRVALTELLRRADVLVENFRPGVLERLGFSADTLADINPRLVMLSISGFGHDGPEAGRAGYDQIAQGEAGLMAITGQPGGVPTRVGVPIGDILAGMNGAFGVLAALRERDRTGRGRLVRTSLLSSIVAAHTFQGTRYTVAGEVAGLTGNHHPSICPYGMFATRDGYVQIAVGNDALWRTFAAEFGLERPQWSTNPARVEDRTAVVEAIESAFGSWTSSEVVTRVGRIGVPAGRIRELREVYAWDQVRAQGLLIDVDHSALGAIALPGSALRFDGDDAGPHCPPPVLDEHGDAIRAWLARPEASVNA